MLKYTTFSKYTIEEKSFPDLPGGPVARNLPASFGGYLFSTWSGKDLLHSDQLSPGATTTEAQGLRACSAIQEKSPQEMPEGQGKQRGVAPTVCNWRKSMFSQKEK